MLKSLWTIITVLALANFLAIAGFVGWLVATDRLNLERLERVRVMLAETHGAEQGRLAIEKAAFEQVQAEAAAEAEAAKPPETAETKIATSAEADEVARLRAERLKRETADLIETLLREREDVDRRQAALVKERKEFEAMRAEIARLEGSEQFEKAVQLYQSLKADAAREVMSELIGKGQTDQVVSYLNAMSSRTAGKIIASFHAESPAQAADLLERLRLRGMDLPPITEPGA